MKWIGEKGEDSEKLRRLIAKRDKRQELERINSIDRSIHTKIPMKLLVVFALSAALLCATAANTNAAMSLAEVRAIMFSLPHK